MQLRLEATVSPRLPRYSFQRGRVPAGSARLEAQSATNFFRRLSQLRVHFDASPTPSQADVQWPGFGLETQQEHGLYRKPSRKRKRREESALLEGVVSELEVCAVCAWVVSRLLAPRSHAYTTVGQICLKLNAVLITTVHPRHIRIYECCKPATDTRISLST